MNSDGNLRVVLVRHGQTQGNVDGVVQGHSDTPLVEKGVISSRIKAEKIKDTPFDAVFCSDLKRAVHTLDLLRDTCTTLPKAVYTRELREIDFGDLTGRLKDEIMPIILEHKKNPNLPYPNGESGGQFILRVKGFFQVLKENFMGGQILVVTHFGVMETAARQFTVPPGYDPIMIGGRDVWRLMFDKNGLVERQVF